MNEFEKCTILKDGMVSYSTGLSDMKQYGKSPVEQMVDKGLLKLAEENVALRQQIDKLKTCDNCKRNEPFKLCMDCTGRDNWQMKGVESRK